MLTIILYERTRTVARAICWTGCAHPPIRACVRRRLCGVWTCATLGECGLFSFFFSTVRSVLLGVHGRRWGPTHSQPHERERSREYIWALPTGQQKPIVINHEGIVFGNKNENLILFQQFSPKGSGTETRRQLNSPDRFGATTSDVWITWHHMLIPCLPRLPFLVRIRRREYFPHFEEHTFQTVQNN